MGCVSFERGIASEAPFAQAGLCGQSVRLLSPMSIMAVCVRSAAFLGKHLDPSFRVTLCQLRLARFTLRRQLENGNRSLQPAFLHLVR